MLTSEIREQSVRLFIELGIASLLSAAVELKREVGRNSSGLHTYAVVGTIVAVFLLISKCGFH